MALAGKTTDKELDKGRVDKTRVKRYWQGRAPDWGDVVDDDFTAPRERLRTEITAPVIVRRGEDARLQRLAVGAEDKAEALQRRREVRAPEIVSTSRRHPREEDEAEGDGDKAKRHGDDDDDEDVAAGRRRDQAPEDSSEELEGDVQQQRRRRPSETAAVDEESEEKAALARREALREKLLQQRQDEEVLVPAEEEEEEESSEYETDSEDEAATFGTRRLLKPVFVPKQSRETILEREKLEAAEAELAVQNKLRLEERKVETRQMVVERIAQEEAAARAAKAGPLELADVNTDDEEDEQKEYEAWKQRELRRIKQEREEKETYDREAAERERLKNMTDDERKAWERANPKGGDAAPQKAKWGFMQKYYHKGAYFQEAPDDARGTAGTDEIYRRDFSAPTGEDRYDKSVLPSVMQIKNFGRSGRTKWTHLLAEDTSQAAMPGDALMAALKEQQQKRERDAFAQPEQFAKPKKFKA